MIAIAPDLLGFGTSDKPPGEYTAELQLSVIQSVLSQYFEKLLIYSRVDTYAPWQHGQELAQHLKKSKLELLENTSHVDLGQAALHEVLAFLQASSH